MMFVPVQDTALRLIEKATSDLLAVLEATPPDKLFWSPLGDARPIWEQAVECSIANRMWAQILTTRRFAVLPEGVADSIYASTREMTQIVDLLKVTSQELQKAVGALDAESLTKVIEFPDASGEGKSVAECIFHPLWNMNYHHGQICYIQTLYGDYDEHCDAGPFGRTP